MYLAGRLTLLYVDLNRRRFLAASAASVPFFAPPPSLAAGHSFSSGPNSFLLDGQPFRIFSGEMHYPRVPRSCWRDRLRKMRSLGLNTLCTYCFWNAHEPAPGQWDFTGNLDIQTFLKTAQDEGLFVILRPGPYVCAEWDFGGFPAWLLADSGMRVRSADPKFLNAASAYMQRLAAEVVPLQISHGGPIILCQVENEYGSFGDDPVYKKAIRQMLTDSSFDPRSFYTADGPSLVPRGSFPDLPAVINFGANEDPAPQFATLDKIRPSGPRMCGEFWTGWFDHWGETHNGMTVKDVCRGLDWMLAHNASFNLYMAHGGSSFGFMAGANRGHYYQPDVSSYDYDAPLDEAGRPTEKFFAVQSLIRKHAPTSFSTSTSFPPLPPPEPAIKIPRFPLTEAASLWSLLGRPQHSDTPRFMESLGQSHGLVLYRTSVSASGEGILTLPDVRDYALLYHGQQRFAPLDRRFGQTEIPVKLQAGVPLDILVDTMGHVNFGPALVDDRKGVLGGVFFNGQELRGWQNYSLPLLDLSKLQFSAQTPVAGPSFYRGQVELHHLGYTFLDTRGWGKGYMWINGKNLGRYWSAGPQRTLYLPAEWLHSGANEFIVLDLHEGGERALESLTNPIYDMSTAPARTT